MTANKELVGANEAIGKPVDQLGVLKLSYAPFTYLTPIDAETTQLSAVKLRRQNLSLEIEGPIYRDDMHACSSNERYYSLEVCCRMSGWVAPLQATQIFRSVGLACTIQSG